MNIRAHHFWQIVKELCGQKHMRVLFHDETHTRRKIVESRNDPAQMNFDFVAGDSAGPPPDDLAVELIANII